MSYRLIACFFLFCWFSFQPSQAIAQSRQQLEETLAANKANYYAALEKYRTQERDTLLLRELNWVYRGLEHSLAFGADTIAILTKQLADSLGVRKFQRIARGQLGGTYFRMGFYDLAIQETMELDSMAHQIGDEVHQMHIALGLAVTYSYQGTYDKAIRHFNQVRDYFEKEGKEPIDKYYIQFSYFYYLQGEYEEALRLIELALQAIKDTRTTRDPVRITKHYQQIEAEKGVILLGMKRYAEAIPLLRRGLDGYGAYQNISFNWRGGAYCYHNLGLAYLELGNLDSAYWYLQESLNINKILQNRNMLAQTAIALGDLYQLKGAPQLSESLYQSSIQLAATPAVREATKDALFALARLYESQGEPYRALDYYHRYDSIRTHILDESLRKTRSMINEFSEELHTTEVKALTQEASLYSRLSWTLGGSGLLGLGLLGLLVNRYKLRSDLALRKQRSMALQRENAQLAKEKLQSEVDHQQRELASTTLHAMQKNELLTSVQAGLRTLAEQHPKAKPSVRQLCRTIEQGLQQDRDWDHFKLHFERVHPAFFASLQEQFPQLSPNDLKHCAYLRINLNVKEVAHMLGIAASSVTMSRYRLKKKLGLVPDDSLGDFIAKI